MSARITREEHRQLGKTSPPVRRVSDVGARVVGRRDPLREITAVKSQVMGRLDRDVVDPGNGERPRNFLFNATGVEARVMFTRTPDFRWLEMLIREVFPFDISFNSIGATRFQTDVTMVDSGDDQRNSRWTQPLMEYDIAYGVRTREQLDGLVAFFRAMKGRQYSFLYFDNVDHTSTQAVDVEARHAPDPHWTDQLLGVGDGVTKVFQLQKKYTTPTGLYSQFRPIYKPMPNTVQVGLDGDRVLNWNVDLDTGKVTFFSRLVKSGLTNMQMVHVGTSGTTWQIVAPDPNTFAGFNPGDKIVTWGWINPLNNSTEDIPLVIGDVSDDLTTLTFTAPASFGAVETALANVTVEIHPAPKAGAQVTAGYKFYVPVRFDTDRLPISIEAYGIGGAADVKLVEVRPNSE